jgi:hypothetical protein
VKPNARNAAQPVAIFGWMLQVRVDRLIPESAQTQFTLFFGKLDQILLDMACRWWHAITSFLEYSVKLGRKWITTQEALKKSTPNKWRNEIAPFASLRWNIICHKHKAQMEAIVIWLTIHKAVAMNECHGRILTVINKSCPHCGTQDVESLKHVFFNCPMTQQVWHYVVVLYQ